MLFFRPQTLCIYKFNQKPMFSTAILSLMPFSLTISSTTEATLSTWPHVITVNYYFFIDNGFCLWAFSHLKLDCSHSSFFLSVNLIVIYYVVSIVNKLFSKLNSSNSDMIFFIFQMPTNHYWGFWLLTDRGAFSLLHSTVLQIYLLTEFKSRESESFIIFFPFP